jgi:hypothetical protein
MCSWIAGTAAPLQKEFNKKLSIYEVQSVLAESHLRAAQAQGRLFGALPTLALPGSSAHNGS